MAWLMDVYSMQEGETITGAVTGKTPVIGGSEGREEAPDRSVAIITEPACEYYDQPVEETTVAVQGYGSVGANAARLLDDWGNSIVAISDVNGAMYDPDGIDTRSVPSHDEEPEAVTDHADDVISNEELLILGIDVLIPAALENTITEETVGAIGADMVVEGANGPTTSAGDAILTERGVPVIPDTLANAGGVTVNYFEWLQDINWRAWSLKRVNEELETEMRSAWKASGPSSTGGRSRDETQATSLRFRGLLMLMKSGDFGLKIQHEHRRVALLCLVL